MDLRQLKYFIAVAEERHLGRAASRLHLSQPPLSRQIQALETELGAVLFVRTARGMLLTRAGEALLEDARSLQALAEQARERTRRAGRGELGRLDIGVYGSAVFGVVPQLLAEFRRRHPEVELALHLAQTPAQVLALRQRRVLLVFERLLPDEPDIAVEPVAVEPLWVALAESHALARLDSVAVARLRDQLLLIGSSPAARDNARRLCLAHGFEPRFAAPASDVVIATLLAAGGSGVTLVPESMTNVHFPGIAYRPLAPAADATMELHCFYLRDEASPLLHVLLETVREFRRAGRAPAG